MKRSVFSAPLLFLLCVAGAHAQLYKWVGPDGKVNYTDSPPPPSAAKVESKAISGGGPSVADLPFELAEAARSNPVTLYTTQNCGPCDEGRKLLTERGIPFAEKTVSSNEDIAQLKQTSGNTQLPLLIIGRNKQPGFGADGWNAALTAAGYPESSKLPRNYRNPQAQAAAPAKPAVNGKPERQTDDRNATSPGSSELPPATGNAPPGFRF